MFAPTGVKSNGKLSAPSIRSELVRGCCARRGCARPPCALFISTSALMWMTSSSKQERTTESVVNFSIFKPEKLRDFIKSSNPWTKSRHEKFFLKRWRGHESSRRNAGYSCPWSAFRASSSAWRKACPGLGRQRSVLLSEVPLTTTPPSCPHSLPPHNKYYPLDVRTYTQIQSI